ncbi:MAG: hypothetical protein QXZ45_06995 [Candidatus Nezhaarchaeales archaeon]
MSKAVDVLRDERVQRILKTIKDRNVELIEPKVGFNVAVRYPVLDGTGIPPEDIMKYLSMLTEIGILISEVVDNVVVCPQCSSHRLMIRVRCPLCLSSKLVMGRMIEHIACGHIDFEEKFKSEEGLYCPKCKKPLHQLGVDYNLFSPLYKCLACKNTFSSPSIEHVCDNGHTFKKEELTIHNVMAFKVNPKKKSLVESITFDVEVVLKPLRDEGLIIVAPAIIQGRSGVKHEFSFAIQRSKDLPPDIIGSVHISDRAVSAIDVLALWAKARDVAVNNIIMITFSGIDEIGMKLAEAYAMKIIDCKDIYEAAIEVKNHVAKMLKELQRRLG